MWTSRRTWLTAVAATLDTPAGQAARTAARIAPATVLAVAEHDAATADGRTGRGVATAHATVAAALGCSPKTVQRARTLLEALGLARTVTRGRYLAAHERAAARAAHGGRQLRIASTRALVHPRPGTGTADVHLPRRGKGPRDLQTSKTYQRARRRTPVRTHRDWRPTLPTQRLAARLAARVPALGRTHLWGLCRVLERHGLDSDGWTAGDVLTALDARNRDLGRYSVAAPSQRSPLALLSHQLAQAIPAGTEPPRRVAARIAAQRRADIAAQAQAVAAEDRQRAAEADDIAAIIAGIKGRSSGRSRVAVPPVMRRAGGGNGGAR